jgi:hypothetical protein
MPTTTTAEATRIGGAKFDRSRKFGVEMEAYGAEPARVAEELTRAGVPCRAETYNHTTRAHWKVVSDGSIRGERPFELVSPPMQGEDGLRQIRTVCAVLEALNVKVNRSTGLHVHHDAADLDLSALKAVVTMWWKYEDVILYFLPPSRRNNYYCAPAMPRGGVCGYRWQPVNGDPVVGWKLAMDSIANREDLRGFMVNQRYCAVNFDSLWRHGTVEFRAHSGTTSADKIVAWVVLTQWMITRSKESGCRVSARMTGRWADESRFFFRAIDWVNLDDEVVIKAKNTLRVRFNLFKGEGANSAAARTNTMRDGRPVQGPEALQEEAGQ